MKKILLLCLSCLLIVCSCNSESKSVTTISDLTTTPQTTSDTVIPTTNEQATSEATSTTTEAPKTLIEEVTSEVTTETPVETTAQTEEELLEEIVETTETTKAPATEKDAPEDTKVSTITIKSDEIELISEFSTLYSLEEEFAGKAYNINLCCGEVTTVIKKGKQFNWHVIVGNTNKAEGYHLANVYSGGQVVQGYGGGVCQVSTTIYGCVRDLGLNVIEMHHHGMEVKYVDWYAGEDAAVDDIGGFNFIFENNLDYDIYIKAFTSTVPENDLSEQGKLTVQFYKIKS